MKLTNIEESLRQTEENLRKTKDKHNRIFQEKLTNVYDCLQNSGRILRRNRPLTKALVYTGDTLKDNHIGGGGSPPPIFLHCLYSILGRLHYTQILFVRGADSPQNRR